MELYNKYTLVSCADPIAMLVEHWFICLIGDIALVMENKN